MRTSARLAVALVLGAGASTAMADGVIRLFAGPWQSGIAGEYQVKVESGNVGIFGGPASAGQPADTFQTFCLEIQEPLEFVTEYNAHINTVAIAGSFGAVNGQDPLDPRTAFLYTMFRAGTLQGYRFNGTADERKADAATLQAAIWFIEEPGAPEGQNNQFVALANAANWTTIGDVRVLNVYTRNSDGSDGPNAQDVLTIIPIPQAALAGAPVLAALAGSLAFRRRRA